MSAFRQFLDRDSMAKAVVVTVLSAAALAMVPASQATNLPANAGGLFSAPGHVLVTLDLQARKLDGVVHALRESTTRCIADQARFLDRDGLGSGDTALSHKALKRRGDDLAADRRSDRGTATARDLIDRDGVPEAHRARLAHHVGLREVCLGLAERSMESVKSLLGRPGPDLEAVRAVASRDAGFVRMLAGSDLDRVDPDMIQAMETYGPR